MRRPTLIVIIVLFVLITVVAVRQLMIASGDRPPYRGPISPGQLPIVSGTPSY